MGGIRTKSGREIEGDLVVVGAGVHPDTMLAERAGLQVDNGIVCDSKLETSVEGIFAAGDVCSYDSVVHGRRLRIEHWDVALQQGQHVAGGLLGDPEPYRVVPYFFSDLADWTSLEYVGPAERWDEIVWRGDRDAGEFSAWYLDGGKVAAALSVGRSEDLAHARRLLESGADVSETEGRAGGRGQRFGAGGIRLGLGRCGRTCRLQADYSSPAGAGWCNGNTPASGAGIRGSSPWPAAQRRK